MRTEYRDPETGWDVLREPIDNGTGFREVITDPETGEQHERKTLAGRRAAGCGRMADEYRK